MHAFENRMQQNIQYCLHVNILLINTLKQLGDYYYVKLTRYGYPYIYTELKLLR